MFGFGCGKQGHGPFAVGFGPPPWVRHKLKMQHCGGPFAILRDLDLTDDQLEKLAELKMEGLSSFGKFKSALIGFAQQIGRELTNDQIDKAKVREIADRIKTAKSEFGDSILEHIISVAETLTPAQRKQVRIKLIKCFLGVDAPQPERE